MIHFFDLWSCTSDTQITFDRKAWPNTNTNVTWFICADLILCWDEIANVDQTLSSTDIPAPLAPPTNKCDRALQLAISL